YRDRSYGPVFVGLSDTGEIWHSQAVGDMAFTDGDNNYAFPSCLLHPLCKGLSHCLLPCQLCLEKGLEIFDRPLLVYRVLFADPGPVSGVVEMKVTGHLGALVGR